ncbi:MAG: TonB-dependent receptor [Saccharospirillaceae bacterium]|nr:TonB-dependent receptor [Pseudomonadales bacterium]NRB80270.1 TonB-dependent receptor [Saccharospirillaceae bacterium]
MKNTMFLTAALLLSNTALGDSLDNVQVQADRTGVPLHLSNLNIEIIPITLADGSLTDVLQKSGSITINNMHHQDGTSVSLNGMDSNHVLITLDGLAINPSGLTVNLDDINMANIKRIEILKGNASSQYGSKALGGVINLVSKPIVGKSKPNVSVHYKKHKQQASLLGDASTKINYDQILGDLKLSHNFQFNNYSETKLDADGYDSQHSSGYRFLINEKLNWNNFSTSAQLNIKRLTRPFIHEAATTDIPKDKIEKEDRAFIQMNYNPKSFKSSAKYQVVNYQSIQDAIKTEDYEDTKRNTISHFVQGDIQKTTHFNTQSITYGAFTHVESLSLTKKEQFGDIITKTNELTVPRSKSSFELFVLHDWYANDQLNIQSGLRTQLDSNFGLFHSPNITLRWDINSAHVVKASTGIGYRVPNLKERHFRFDHSIYGYEVLGNENLTPETSFSSNVKWEFKSSKIKLSNNMYAHLLENLIERLLDESIDNGLDSYININNGEAAIIGLDSQLNWQVSNTIDLNLSSNLLQASYSIDQTQMIDKPNQIYKANANWSYSSKSKVSTQLSLQRGAINSELSQKPDVFLVNLNWQQQFKNDLTLNLTINNITNQIKDSEFTGDSRPDTGLELAVHLSYQP